jgi:hypothetical protein
MSSDKAPGPDGFTRLRFQTTWPIIKYNIMQAFHSLWSLDFHNCYLVNQAYMVLLHKKRDMKEVRDFRTISLIHDFNKLVAKTLSQRLTPFIDGLVMPNWSTSIKGRTIYDNFMIVQSIAKLLRACRQSCILLKIDIAKAIPLGPAPTSGFLSMLDQLDFHPAI